MSYRKKQAQGMNLGMQHEKGRKQARPADPYNNKRREDKRLDDTHWVQVTFKETRRQQIGLNCIELT